MSSTDDIFQSLVYKMNQSEFNFLVTNLSAITNQIFAIRCGEFGAAVSNDESNDLPVSEFDMDENHKNFDYQSILDSGYRDIDALEVELNNAWSLVEHDRLKQLQGELSGDFPSLLEPISGDQLKFCITQSLSAESDSPLYVLHQYVLGLFQVDEDIHDLIREAIANDEIDDLLEEANVSTKHILIDDLITAAEIQSFAAFEWLFSRAELNDEQIVTIFEGCFYEEYVIERMYAIVSPTKALHKAILDKAKETDYETVVTLLNKIDLKS